MSTAASVVSVVLAVAAGGAVASVETTDLLTVEETLEALAKANEIVYRRPEESESAYPLLPTTLVRREPERVRVGVAESGGRQRAGSRSSE